MALVSLPLGSALGGVDLRVLVQHRRAVRVLGSALDRQRDLAAGRVHLLLAAAERKVAGHHVLDQRPLLHQIGLARDRQRRVVVAADGGEGRAVVERVAVVGPGGQRLRAGLGVAVAAVDVVLLQLVARLESVLGDEDEAGVALELGEGGVPVAGDRAGVAAGLARELAVGRLLRRLAGRVGGRVRRRVVVVRAATGERDERGEGRGGEDRSGHVSCPCLGKKDHDHIDSGSRVSAPRPVRWTPRPCRPRHVVGTMKSGRMPLSRIAASASSVRIRP